MTPESAHSPLMQCCRASEAQKQYQRRVEPVMSEVLDKDLEKVLDGSISWPGAIFILGGNYRVLLVCRHLDHSKWVLMESLALSLPEVLDTEWDFDCPDHGPQREKPLQAEEKNEPD